jgi:hypothetical protein
VPLSAGTACPSTSLKFVLVYGPAGRHKVLCGRRPKHCINGNDIHGAGLKLTLSKNSPLIVLKAVQTLGKDSACLRGRVIKSERPVLLDWDPLIRAHEPDTAELMR